MAMKYVKLFEHWLNEAESSSKMFNEMTIGDLRSSSDKGELLKSFFEQFTYVPENKKDKSAGDYLQIEDVKVNNFEYKGSGFTSAFFDKDKEQNEENLSKEYKEVFTEKEIERIVKKSASNNFEFKNIFGFSVEGFANNKLDDFEGILERYKAIEEKFSKIKDSKILPIIKKDIESLQKKIEFIKSSYPNGKATEIILGFNLLLKGEGAWEDKDYVILISKGLENTKDNPDGSKLTDFIVDGIKPQAQGPESTPTTLGSIGLWIKNGVEKLASDVSILKADKAKNQPLYAGVVKNVKTFTASAKKKKK